MQMNLPLNQYILEKLSLLEFYLESDITLYPFVEDLFGIFKEYLKLKYDYKLKIEGLTINEFTLTNIDEALKEGEILIIEDPDEELIEVI